MKITKKLIKLARTECEKHSVRLFLGKGKSLAYYKNIKVNGYFDCNGSLRKTPTLAVASKTNNFTLVLVHEMCHMIQWIENCKEWKDYVAIKNFQIDKACANESFDQKLLDNHCWITMLLERDCERKAHTILKSLGYQDKKLKEYVQKANAYTIFYLFVADNKKWYKVGSEPYSIKAVWKKFPDTFDINIKQTYKDLGNLYNKCIK